VPEPRQPSGLRGGRHIASFMVSGGAGAA
jgi:hypothetical protein